MGVLEIAETIDLAGRKVAFEIAQAQTNVQSEKFELLIEYFKANLLRAFGTVIEKTNISTVTSHAGSKRTESGNVSIYDEWHSFTLSFSSHETGALLEEFIEEMKRVAYEYGGEFKGYQKSLTRGFPDYITIHFPHPNPIHESQEP